MRTGRAAIPNERRIPTVRRQNAGLPPSALQTPATRSGDGKARWYGHSTSRFWRASGHHGRCHGGHAMPKRHELTDAQWAKIEALLPGRESDPGRTAADNRLFVNAVVFVLKTGIPWADLPGRFGKHDTVRKRFDRWCAG